MALPKQVSSSIEEIDEDFVLGDPSMRLLSQRVMWPSMLVYNMELMPKFTGRKRILLIYILYLSDVQVCYVRLYLHTVTMGPSNQERSLFLERDKQGEKMVRTLAILLENDFSYKPIISHAIIILFVGSVIGVVIFNCSKKVKRRPQPANNMTYYGSGGGSYNKPDKAEGGKGGGGMGGAAMGLAAGAGVGLAAVVATDAVIDANDNEKHNDSKVGCFGGGGCGGVGCGGGCGGCGGG